MSTNRPTISGSVISPAVFFALLFSATFTSLFAQNVSTLQGRQYAAVAHDTEDSQFLLFGGTDGRTRFQDTWLLGASGWKPSEAIVNPSPRISSAVTYDSVRDQFVLFGGRVKNARLPLCSPGVVPKGLKDEMFCRDTWVFRGRVWIKKTPTTSPTQREFHAMAFDTASAQVVMFGGVSDASSTPLADTWVWNGSTWKQIITAHKPPARFMHTMAYDPIHQQVVMFGGNNGKTILNDTWLWNGRDWLPAPPQTTPPDFYTGAGMAYSSTLRKMVLFSGLTWNGPHLGVPSQNSWTWDGGQWKKLPATSFQLITDFSKLTNAQASKAIAASGTPTMLWLAR